MRLLYNIVWGVCFTAYLIDSYIYILLILFHYFPIDHSCYLLKFFSNFANFIHVQLIFSQFNLLSVSFLHFTIIFSFSCMLFFL